MASTLGNSWLKLSFVCLPGTFPTALLASGTLHKDWTLSPGDNFPSPNRNLLKLLLKLKPDICTISNIYMWRY